METFNLSKQRSKIYIQLLFFSLFLVSFNY